MWSVEITSAYNRLSHVIQTSLVSHTYLIQFNSPLFDCLAFFGLFVKLMTVAEEMLSNRRKIHYVTLRMVRSSPAESCLLFGSTAFLKLLLMGLVLKHNIYGHVMRNHAHIPYHTAVFLMYVGPHCVVHDCL